MFLVSFLSFFVSTGFALRIPVARRASAHSTTVTINTHYNGNLGWSNVGDALYSATVYVQGQPFQVQIDTGSADLWINTEGVTLDGLIDTGHNATISYVDTTAASGPLVMANVSFGEFTVEGQAMINAPGSNASIPGVNDGLLGVGPPDASSIYQGLSKANSSFSGLPFLLNVFSLNPTEPSFISFLLSRSDLGLTEGGVMTISELVSNYTEITETPKLPVISERFWGAYMDGVYVDGKLFTGNSFGVHGVTAEPSKNQTMIVLDTGTSYATAPPYYVDAMYKHLPGAVYNESISGYTLPCHTKVNISMVFGSETYPINPIDATALNVNLDGSFWCQGTFSYTGPDDGVDFILGDAFLRNVYSLFNYGDNYTGHGTESPYMQILSITDADQAWADFDWLNIQRIVQSEYTEFSNSTSSAHAASETSSYSLVAPSSSAISSVSVASTSQTSTRSSSSAYSGTSAASHSSSASATSSSSAEKLGADLAANVQATASASSSSSNVDLSGVLRNSYIIMGILAVVLILLIGILVKLITSSRNSRYKQVPTVIPPAHFGKPYEPDSETFSTPYDDLARPLP